MLKSLGRDSLTNYNISILARGKKMFFVPYLESIS